MSAPVKKVAETIARTVIPKASRAVTAAEAPFIEPSSTSSTTTSMPWDGWFSSFLKDKLGTERYEKIRRTVLFSPDDIHELNQQVKPLTKVPITPDGSVTAQFRYPSPGSQPPVRIPSEDKGTLYEDPYFVAYYPRDTARRALDPESPNPEAEALKLELLPQDDPRVQEAKKSLLNGPQSSPGNKGRFATGPSDFDPIGLRATMSTSQVATNKALDANMPDHLPMPEWWDKQDQVVAWYKERDLPVPLGATGWGTVPKKGRIARW